VTPELCPACKIPMRPMRPGYWLHPTETPRAENCDLVGFAAIGGEPQIIQKEGDPS